MPFFEYFALEPLANRALLDSGFGAVPMTNASRAYSAVENALDSAATGTDGLIETMRSAWPGGLSAQRAQSAFKKHNSWVREQASASQVIAKLADAGEGLHNNALATMPSQFEIEAAMEALAASAALMASSGAVAATGVPGVSAAALLVFGAASVSHAAAEAEYHRLRIQAAGTMMNYEIGALQVLGYLVQVAGALTPPPPIVVPGPGAPPTETLDVVGPLQNLIKTGPDSKHYPTNTKTGQDTGGHPDNTNTSEPGGDSSEKGPGGDSSDPGTSGADQQSLGEPKQSLGSQSGLDNSGMDGYGTDNSSSSPLLGVSSESSTLVAIGGVGGLAGFGMIRGGIDAMSGASTGFRLPGGWKPASGTAFGAANPPAASSAPARGAARRVSAPTARMRRRRRDEETRTGKVFTPGEHIEVPELALPPVIGVIEYQDDEVDNDSFADSSLVGVLDRLDDGAEEGQWIQRPVS